MEWMHKEVTNMDKRISRAAGAALAALFLTAAPFGAPAVSANGAKAKTAQSTADKNTAAKAEKTTPPAGKEATGSKTAKKEDARPPAEGTITIRVAEPSTELPNPIVSYDDYWDAASALGFGPLCLPGAAGYQLKDVSVISGDLADLTYEHYNGDTKTFDAKIRLRSARAEKMQGTDISGIYGAKWKKKTIRHTQVEFTRLVSGQAARWHVGDYLFSAQAEGLEPLAFERLVTVYLIDLSEHYFIDNPKGMMP